MGVSHGDGVTHRRRMRARVASLRPAAAPTDAHPRSESHRREPTRGCPGRRGHPVAASVVQRLAFRDPGDRPPRAAAPRRAAADHRRRRVADHLLRRQHPRMADRRPRDPAPAPGTGRGPDPQPQGHRPANLPLQAFAKNVIWLELVQLAAKLPASAQTLALADHPARRWEPNRLRLRILHTAARLIRSGRRRTLRISRDWPGGPHHRSPHAADSVHLTHRPRLHDQGPEHRRAAAPGDPPALITETTRDPPTAPESRPAPHHTKDRG